jgi:kynureninase
MHPTFSPTIGAQGFQQSNPSVLAVASLIGSLQVFKSAGMMEPLRRRSVQLTAKLESLLKKSKYYVSPEESFSPSAKGFTIITPSDPEARGAQLSLLFLPVGSGVMQKVIDRLKSWGVIGDERKPDVIRLAPVPLYNELEDCERAAEYVERSFDALIAIEV